MPTWVLGALPGGPGLTARNLARPSWQTGLALPAAESQRPRVWSAAERRNSKGGCRSGGCGRVGANSYPVEADLCAGGGAEVRDEGVATFGSESRLRRSRGRNYDAAGEWGRDKSAKFEPGASSSPLGLGNDAGCCCRGFRDSKPERSREPNNVSTQATGPVGGKGIIVRDDNGLDPDWFYFKVKPHRRFTISVKSLNYMCGNNPNQDFVKTATVHGQLYNFEEVAGIAGAGESFSIPPFNRVTLIAGELYPNLGNSGKGKTGCSQLVRITPASVLILSRSPRDKRILANEHIAEQ